MSITTKFNIEFDDKGLKQAEQKAKQTADKIQQDVNKAKSKNMKDLDKGIKSIGQSLSGLGGITNVLAGKFAAMGVAIGVAIKTVKDLWDSFTESAEEFQLKKGYQLEQRKKDTETTLKTQQTDNGYYSRLQQINAVEDRSNVLKQQAIKLIEILTKRYGDLGIKINAVTGEITGLDDAQQKILAKQNAELYKKLSGEKTDLQDLQRGKTRSVFTSTFSNMPTTNWLSQKIYELTGRMPESVAESLDVYENSTAEQQLKILQSLRDNSNRKQDIELYQQLIDLKKQEIRLQQQLNSLEQTGAMDEKSAMEQAKARSMKDRVQKNNQQARGEFKKQDDLQGQILAMRESAEYARITDEQEKLLYLKKKLTEYQEQERNLAREQQEIENATYGDELERSKDYVRMLKIQQRINQERAKGTPEGEQQAKNWEKELLKLQTKTYKSDQARSEDNLAYQRLETDRLQVLKNQQQVKIEIAKIEERTKNYYAETEKALQNEIDYNTLILQGNFEEAERLKLINELKKQGIKIDEKEIDKIQEKKKQLAGISLTQGLKKQAEKLLDKYTPKTKDYQYQQRIKQLQESTKRPLTDTEKEKVKSLVNAERELENIDRIYKPDLSKFEVKTNDLTARGGFQTGAVAPEKDRINTEIKNYAAKQVTLLEQIKTELQNAGLI